MSRVSVVSIALENEELDDLRESLEKQTYKDFEFIPIVGDMSIPEAWNMGIDMAKGDYILFTESDVEIPEDWIEKMVERLEEKGFVMGYEIIIPQKNHCMSSVGIKSDWGKSTPFNEDMDITEDTEWFARLMKKYDFTIQKDRNIPVVFHNKDQSKLSWAFKHGVHRAEIWLEYQYEGKSASDVTSRRLNRILSEVLTLIGQGWGLLKHPIKAMRRLL